MRGRTVDDARGWIELELAERRRLAEQACRDTDAEALWSLTEAYLALERGSEQPLSPATRRSYRWSIDVLLVRWSGELLMHPSHEDAEAFVRGLQESGMSPSTVKVHLVGARMLYRALRWAEVTDADPFRDVRPSAEVGRPATRRQAYSEAELQRLLALAEPVDRVVILLATDAGLRVSESVGLMWDAVDLERSQLLLPGSDGDAVRVVALTPALARALGQLPHDREGRVLGFTSDVWARRRLQHLCERAGVPYRGLDSLRQTAHAGHALSESLDRLPGGDRANVGPPKTHHLTGVPSQGALREELVRAVAEANRIHSYSALLLIRLEYLRSVLAERDPETEAAVLKAVAARLDRARRPYDFLAQTDDDTFAVLLRHIPSSAALASVADRLSNILRSHPIAIGGKEIPLEPAVGTIMGPGEPEQLISAALAALGHKES